MSNIGYVHDIQGIGEDGFNDGGIHSFTGSKLFEYLTRENGQNSLDAGDPEKETVVLKFRAESLMIDDYPEFRGLRTLITECQQYWKDREDEKCNSFFNEAQSILASGRMDILIISDYNTMGAKGAKNAPHSKSKWRALTSSNGVTENNQGSGGAYGIGKNAPFACSAFRTIFYNTYSKEDDVHAFQGTSKLVTHKHNGQYYKGYGFCWDTENNSPVFEKGISPLMDYLNRNEYGTDVVITGFKKSSNWNEIIERAAINNFFIAIANRKLIIDIDGKEINDLNLKDRMEYYASKEINLPEKEKTVSARLEYYSAFTNPDYEISGNIIEADDVVLYIKKDDSYSKTIAEMRAIGMVVRTRTKNIFSRYAAVLTVKEGKLNNLLKRIEPPTHDEWDSGLIEDPIEQKEAEKIRKKLVKWVNDEIVNNCKGDLKEEFDLEGISAYLPFDEDDTSLGSNSSEIQGKEGEALNSPDSDSRALPTELKKLQVHKISVSAQKVKGRREENIEPHNETKGGHGKGHGGIEDSEGVDDVTVVKDGKKTANIPKIVRQRIISAYKDGRYVALFQLEEDCPKVVISVQAVGDDNRKEPLKISSFRLDLEKETPANSSTITLNNILGGKLYKVFISLEYKERLTLLMNIG